MYVPIFLLAAMAVTGPLLGTLLGYGLSNAAASRMNRKGERKTLVQLAIELAYHKNTLYAYHQSLQSAREKIIGGYGVIDLDIDHRKRLFLEHLIRKPFPTMKNGVMGLNLMHLQDTQTEDILWKMERYEGLLEFVPCMHDNIAQTFRKERIKSSGSIAATSMDGLLKECEQFMSSLEELSRLAVDLVTGLQTGDAEKA